MKSNKILHIITRLDQGGSAENTLYTMVDLKNKGYEVALIIGKTYDPDGLIKKFVSENNMQLHIIPELCRAIRPWNDLRAFIKIWKYIKNCRFDMIHTHSSKAGILGRWAAWFAGVKQIIHTPHGPVFYGYYNRSISWVFLIVEKVTALITKRIICLTHGEMQDYQKYRLCASEKFVVIHSGVELERFVTAHLDPYATRESLGFTNKERIVGVITRLERVKGNKYVILAWHEVVKKFPNARLLIIGEGPEKKMLEKIADHSGVQASVTFTGMRRDLPQLISIMEFLVLPSVNEGMGKVLIQAAVMKKPSIGSNVCGIPDVIKDDETGLLVQPKKPSLLAQAVIRLLDNPDLVKTMGSRAGEFVTESVDGHPRFSRAAMIHKLDILYAGLLHIQ